jgi:hypothetical protein
MLFDAAINWSFSLTVLPLALILLIRNFGLEFAKADYVKLTFEFVFIGMLPFVNSYY